MCESEMSKISVIVPVYNAEQYFRECIDSILRQTYTDFELIIVDDGSTDRSGDIADKYAVADKRVRVLHKQNGGQSSARNAGLDICTGKFIAFVDADDYIHSEMLAQLMNMVLENDCQVAICQYKRVREIVHVDNLKSASYKCMLPEECVEAFLYQDFTIGPCAQLFDHKLFDEGTRFKENIIYEDLDLLYRIYEHADKIVLSPIIVYFYRINNSSTTNIWSQRRLDVLNVTADLEEHYSNNPRLLRAAHDRSLSAAFNILMLNSKYNGDEIVSRKCFDIIRKRRYGSLFNGRVRLKNKIGILASYFGLGFLKTISRFT